MHFNSAARRRLAALTLPSALAGLMLAGCARVDNDLFGDRTPPPTPEAATGGVPEQETATQPEAAPTPQAAPEAAAPGESAAPPEAAAAESAAPAEAPSPPSDLGIQLPAIQPATGTGTTVGKTVDRIHGELSSLHDRIAGDMQQYLSLKGAAAQDVTTYQNAKSRIVIRLQVGTTKGNPELVGQWNTGQSALDGLTGNVNSLVAVANDLSSATAGVSVERDTIASALNAMGAVDEDHRQLGMLRDEATGLGDASDQLERTVTLSVRRQTAFIAEERDSLARLQNAIKNGELYPLAEMEAPPAAASLAVSEAGDAILTVHFDRANVEFEKELYDALNKALQAKPSASFRVEAVAAKRATAQREAQAHARAVLKAMEDMGVPASRVGIVAETDPSVSGSEVRVYAR